MQNPNASENGNNMIKTNILYISIYLGRAGVESPQYLGNGPIACKARARVRGLQSPGGEIVAYIIACHFDACPCNRSGGLQPLWALLAQACKPLQLFSLFADVEEVVFALTFSDPPSTRETRARWIGVLEARTPKRRDQKMQMSMKY